MPALSGPALLPHASALPRLPPSPPIQLAGGEQVAAANGVYTTLTLLLSPVSPLPHLQLAGGEPVAATNGRGGCLNYPYSLLSPSPPFPPLQLAGGEPVAAMVEDEMRKVYGDEIVQVG